ncbi:hypothetical protein JZ751_011531 [Albula glossodonta]|uniref:Uncharacterized protein n=1 Tax=Albula glossodonta TaxID=121402 RepID=A0A8T2N6Y4_9TELE|nr:hypothetical protein JZ751_011531 [Albula glossodonta]
MYQSTSSGNFCKLSGLLTLLNRFYFLRATGAASTGEAVLHGEARCGGTPALIGTETVILFSQTSTASSAEYTSARKGFLCFSLRV